MSDINSPPSSLSVALTLTLNGEQRIFTTSQLPTDLSPTVLWLLTQQQLPTARVAVEVNGQLVRRAQHESYQLYDGDVVEVVTLVGGG